MPPKGGNAKKESGRAKKAENEAKKREAAEVDKEHKEASAWEDKDLKGAKARQQEKEDKRKAELARRAENARLLAEEEALQPPAKPKPAKKAGGGSASKPAGPGAIAAGGGLGSISIKTSEGEPSNPKAKEEEIESFAASGIDNALDLLDVVTAKMDKASVGQQAAGIERHPERRFKATYEAYQERELPNMRREHPGLRLQQYKDLLYKKFQKSPENPFNQTSLAYDAKKADKIAALDAKKAEVEDRLRDN